MAETPATIIHFYRAIVMHADVWRQRLDATTNWAVVTTVGVISFSFTRPESPHFLLILLLAASCLFLLMESRRYQIYDIWRRRIRTLNRYVVAPNLSAEAGPSQEVIEEKLGELAHDLGRIRPHLHFIDAVGYRMRRNYGYIFLFSIGSWVLKLILHPQDVTSTAELLERARIGALPGAMVIVLVGLASLIILFLALRAPSEQMVSWRQVPSPLKRLLASPLIRRQATEEEEEKNLDSPATKDSPGNPDARSKEE